MAESKNLPITYSKLLNVGLRVFIKKYPNHNDYKKIRKLIRKCRALKTIFRILNNYSDFCAIMIDLTHTDELLRALYHWKGKLKNLAIGLKYYNVFVNFIRNPSLRNSKVTWTSHLKIISNSQH